MRIIPFILILLTLCCCGRPDNSERPVIAVSFPTQAGLLEEIAGEDFDIVTLLPAGSDPETFQPSLSTMKELGKADALFTLGTQGFEASLTENLHTNFPDLKIIDCTQGVGKISDSHLAASGSHDPATEGFDPHIMASVRNSAIIAANITALLSDLYPDKATIFRNNSEDVLTRIRAIDDSIAAMGLEGKSFVIRHPSLSYFARDYGLTQIALSDVSKETSPRQLQQRLETAASGKPEVFIIEKEHASPTDGETARMLGLPAIEVSLNSADWLRDLKRIADEIDRD
ncbi:MAG: zinc ABC transporter substrate-binding protein [Muribaculaceae bacterium]|nr:zinc ABC transporter substrate-binding protein [Muribaculaceae bacterium]